MKATTTAERQKKAAGSKKNVKSSKTIVESSTPDLEKIRIKAWDLYNERIQRGEEGTPLEDWIGAESFFYTERQQYPEDSLLSESQDEK
jgi:hypothetical protein